MTPLLALYFLVAALFGAGLTLAIFEGIDDPDDSRPAHVRRKLKIWAPLGVTVLVMLWPLWCGLGLVAFAIEELFHPFEPRKRMEGKDGD